MTPERKFVASEIFLGLSGVWVVFPFSRGSPLEFSVVDIGIIAFVTAVVVCTRYLSEHGEFPDWIVGARNYFQAHPGRLVLLTAVLLIVVLLPLVTVRSTIDEYYAGIAGSYLGFIMYRIVYGVVRPVPDLALERYHAR